MPTALRTSLLRLLALITAAAAVAVASGCGGSDSSSDSAAPAESAPAESSPAATGTDEKGSDTATAAQGKQLFSSAGCVSCHTLADAGASGRIGPNLDD